MPVINAFFMCVTVSPLSRPSAERPCSHISLRKIQLDQASQTPGAPPSTPRHYSCPAFPGAEMVQKRNHTLFALSPGPRADHIPLPGNRIPVIPSPHLPPSNCAHPGSSP